MIDWFWMFVLLYYLGSLVSVIHLPATLGPLIQVRGVHYVLAFCAWPVVMFAVVLATRWRYYYLVLPVLLFVALAVRDVYAAAPGELATPPRPPIECPCPPVVEHCTDDERVCPECG